MAQYIDKDALVAWAKETYLCENASMIRKVCYKQLLEHLDTLEVKEVDLDKEMNEVLTHLTDKDMRGWFRYFFELGLQAQHNNWKVVDNTNHPQEDRTKIYCVFTKQRYILAKVIGHPQDDDLLQWMCTEFPNHRYDMCEGDKYMQIV